MYTETGTRDNLSRTSLVNEIMEELYKRYASADGVLFDIGIAYKGEICRIVEAVLEILGEREEETESDKH